MTDEEETEKKKIRHEKTSAVHKGKSPEYMARIRAMRDVDKLRCDNSVMMKRQIAEWKSSGRLEEIRLKARLKRGLPDHLSAKQWKIRDPLGNEYSISNMSEWARQNTHRFNDTEPGSKQPFWLRVARGLTDLLKENTASRSFKKWTAVCKAELDGSGEVLPVTPGPRKPIDMAVMRENAKNLRKYWTMPEARSEEMTRKRSEQAKRVWANRSDEQKRVYYKKVSEGVQEMIKDGRWNKVMEKGKMTRGLPDHRACKRWDIRDPFGNPHSFTNLREWARQNHHRFVDDRPESKRPFERRVACGINALFDKAGRSCSYKGWVGVSVSELTEGSIDLLHRNQN